VKLAMGDKSQMTMDDLGKTMTKATSAATEMQTLQPTQEDLISKLHDGVE
jgi:hypothetical protein